MITQYGVLPYKADAEAPQFLLVTSRQTGRWVIPKGHPIAGLTPPLSAAQEAFEEAGIEGEVGAAALGAYRYRKRIRFLLPVMARVTVYPLHVTRERATWPEAHQRRRSWFSRTDAATAVEEAELRRMILAFSIPPR